MPGKASSAMRLTNLLRPYHPIRDRVIRAWATRYISNLELPEGDAVELKPKSVDLALLHSAICKRKPKVVLEFGVGFSTIVMGHALKSVGGRLWSVDAERQWIDNTKNKLTDEPVELILSSVQNIGSSHRFEKLPNINPDMIYIDGPSPNSVPDWVGPPISTDLLHYESRLKPGSFVVVDGRYTNVFYMRSLLLRKWDWRIDWRRRRSEAVLVS